MSESTTSRERAERLEELFEEALGMLPEQREELLERRCAGDRELLARVTALLAEDERATRDELRPETLRADGLTSVRIGRYKLVRSLGQGGMGTVYLAEQEEPVRRRVALKTIRRGRLSSAVAARFAAECQALASMDHPGIAKVFDGGTSDDGVPYFVMEYAPGLPITEHCDRAGMTVDARLELLARVCDAVQHAHERGIVHRDLKPSNVLVEPREGGSRPLVVDFGIARALSAPAREEPEVPLSDSLGTPAYMSPERLLAGDPLVDTRDDVYSLGVMLYQLLSGRLPIEAADRKERLRALEREPLAPSARLAALGSELQAVAVARGTTAEELVEHVRGELDAIVLAALARDRSRRYGSAGALADDLRRFLRNDPLAVMGTRPGYRAAKFVRRHRMRLALAGGLVLALVLGLVGTLLGWREARREKELADARSGAERSEREEADLLVRVFQEAILMALANDELHVSEILDRLAGKIDLLGAAEPQARAALHAALGRSFLALGDDLQALEQFKSAYTMIGSELEREDPFDRLDVIEGLIEATRRLGDRDGARVHVRQFVEVARRSFGDHDEHFREALDVLLALADGEVVDDARALDALDVVLDCLVDGIVRGGESGALARILIEAGAQLRFRRSPVSEPFVTALERRVADFFPEGDLRGLVYRWSLLHLRVLPPDLPLQEREATARVAEDLLESSKDLARGHFLRSDVRRLLARVNIDRLRESVEAGAPDLAAYVEAERLLAEALDEARLAPRTRRARLVGKELELLESFRPESLGPDPVLARLVEEAAVAAAAEPAGPGPER